MSTVRTVSLGMGVLSLVASTLAALIIWFLFEFSSQGLPWPPRLPTSASLASASCESLQAICPVLAKHAQTMSELNDVYFRNYEHLFYVVLFGALGWGALSGAGFLFIYAKSGRQGSRE